MIHTVRMAGNVANEAEHKKELRRLVLPCPIGSGDVRVFGSAAMSFIGRKIALSPGPLYNCGGPGI